MGARACAGSNGNNDAKNTDGMEATERRRRKRSRWNEIRWDGFSLLIVVVVVVFIRARFQPRRKKKQKTLIHTRYPIDEQTNTIER